MKKEKLGAKEVMDEVFGKTKYSPSDILRLKRKASGLTTEEVSKRTGIAIETIKAYEAGEREIPQEDAEKLGEALGVHPSTILSAGEDF